MLYVPRPLMTVKPRVYSACGHMCHAEQAESLKSQQSERSRRLSATRTCYTAEGADNVNLSYRGGLQHMQLAQLAGVFQ